MSSKEIIKEAFRKERRKGQRLDEIWEDQKYRELKRHPPHRLDIVLHLIRKIKKEGDSDDVYKRREGIIQMPK